MTLENFKFRQHITKKATSANITKSRQIETFGQLKKLLNSPRVNNSCEASVFK